MSIKQLFWLQHLQQVLQHLFQAADVTQHYS